jgi:molecular chaperone GrpE
LSEDKKVHIHESELNELKEKILRVQADFENRKKRQDKERADFLKFANEGLITELLRVMDDFERAIDSAKNTNDAKVLLQGIEMVRHDFVDILKDSGLKVIDPAGEPFDPEKHEAVEHAEDDKHPDNTILEVLRKGYELNGKVLRPAAVKVSKKKEEQKQEDNKEEV